VCSTNASLAPNTRIPRRQPTTPETNSSQLSPSEEDEEDPTTPYFPLAPLFFPVVLNLNTNEYIDVPHL